MIRPRRAGSQTERQAIRVAAETTPSVIAAKDHIGIGKVASA